MSTHAYIGQTMDNHTVQWIYLHWDGYPQHIAPLLLHVYNTPEKIQELINLGDLSCLYSNIKPPEHHLHTFDNPTENTTVAYHRDRNDDWNTVKPKIATLAEFRNMDSYRYLYDHTKQEWRITKGNRFYKLKE